MVKFEIIDKDTLKVETILDMSESDAGHFALVYDVYVRKIENE